MLLRAVRAFVHQIPARLDNALISDRPGNIRRRSSTLADMRIRDAPLGCEPRK